MAIKSYKSLIAIAKQELDGKQRKLGRLRQQEQMLLDRVDDLDAEVERERDLAARSPWDIARTFPIYAQGAKVRRAKLMKQVEEVRRHMDLARIEVQGAFQEMKKFERAEEMRLEEVRKEEDKRESALMDEIGTNLFMWRRRQEEDLAEIEAARADGRP